jgi:dihydrofolate synthase/folylpolyglutamate synthase
MTLQGALEALYGLERRKSKLGLDGTRAVLAVLGNPERRFRAVHVAGTNGKGTVCALVERVLRAAGHRTGLFTSPHLVDFRERIRVDGRWADDVRLFEMLRQIEERSGVGELTFFEVATALGFGYFAAENVEWAVVEVGLGGRLDTTNVITPEVSVITSIGLDHTEILGSSVREIAFEKAGIVKPGVPVVTGVADGIAAEVIESVARERDAELVAAARRTPVVPVGAGCARANTAAWGPLELTLAHADISSDNAATALATLDVLAARGVAIPAAAVVQGFRAVRWPGRFERSPSQTRLVWDGAHNGAGAARLAATWRAAELPAPDAVVLAVSRDKDVRAMLAPLADLMITPRLIATRTHSERALEPQAIAAMAAAIGWSASVASDVPGACRTALAAAAPDGLVLLTGSLFAIGEAMTAFGGAPGEQL